MVANDTAATAFHGSANRKQITVTPVQDKSQSLVGYSQQSCGACDAPARLFKGSPDQVAFVTKDLRIERKAWRHFHGVRGGGCCLVDINECSRKNSSGAFAKARSDAGVLGVG